MKVIIVKNDVEGGKEGYKVFADAKKNGAKTFGLASISTQLPLIGGGLLKVI